MDINDDAIEAVELLAGVTKVQPGDALIFQFSRQLDMELHERVREAIKLGLPPDTPFLVIGSDIELFVTRQEDDDD